MVEYAVHGAKQAMTESLRVARNGKITTDVVNAAETSDANKYFKYIFLICCGKQSVFGSVIHDIILGSIVRKHSYGDLPNAQAENCLYTRRIQLPRMMKLVI